MCIGAEHQGSTFNVQQQVDFARGSLGALRSEFRRITEKIATTGREELQPPPQQQPEDGE